MNKLISYAAPVLTVLVAIWVSQLLPNPLGYFTRK